MYFTDALRVMGRRWYVLAAGALALVVAFMAVKTWVPAQYQSSGEALLVLHPDASGRKTPTNPLLNPPPGLTTTASLLAGAAMDRTTTLELARHGHRAEYSASVVPGTGPLISVVAKSTSASDATGTRNAVMAGMSAQLQRLQAQVTVPRPQTITVLRMNVDPQPQRLSTNKIRALLVAWVAIAIATLVVAFVLDNWLRTRRQQSRPPTGLVEKEGEDSDAHTVDLLASWAAGSRGTRHLR